MAATWKTMRRWMDRDELLQRLGLEDRTPVSDFFTGLGLFSVGVVVGAGLGLLFAPRRGQEMRRAVGEAWRSRAQKAREWGGETGAEQGARSSA